MEVLFWRNFRIPWLQHSPLAFSAQSILDSTLSCDVTERELPRTLSQYCQIKYGSLFHQVTATSAGSSNVWFQKISIPPPRKTLRFAPPPPSQDFPFQGVFDDPPSPQEFPEFLKGDFAYHPLEILSGLGTLLKVNTNSVSYANTVESYYNSAV